MRPGAKAGCWGVLSFVLLGGSAAADPAVFESPEAAVEAVVSALEARDREALIAVFGPENEDVVLTGDPEDDRATWGAFLRDYRALSRINREGDDLATLAIGRDLWPFPAPLVRDAAGWHFDAEAAREEVLLRRIGQNELDVIDLLRGYVEAQAAYRAMDPDGDGLPAFAAGLEFETDADGARLDDVLLDAAGRDPGALPLLEFALEQRLPLLPERHIAV